MVVRSGFEIQLVHAESKIPFKEHERDGKVYVEVEPDAQYYIAIRRISLDGPAVVMSTFRVDEVPLRYVCQHERHLPPKRNFLGDWSRNNGTSKITALQFTKPSAADKGKGYKGKTGRVTVILHAGVLHGTTQIGDISSSYQPNPVVDSARVSACKKKFLLSTQGRSTYSVKSNKNLMQCYTCGGLIDRFSLRYCSALGLMDAGILPKPDPWALQRLKRPALTGQLRAPFKQMIHPYEEKVIDVVDLTDESAPSKYTW